MKIPKILLKLLDENNASFPEIDAYLDTETGIWCLGNVPRKLKYEIRADIQKESQETRPFSEAFLREIVADEKGFEVVKFALQLFLTFAEKIIGLEQPKRDSELYPWVKALCISPDLSVNARVQLAVDTKAATVFIVINAGVFINLAHRLLAMFSDESFLQNLGKAPLRSNGPTVERIPNNGGWCTLKPTNESRRLVAAWITMFAAMIILQHETAHFVRGHLGYLRNCKSKNRLQEVDDASIEASSEDINIRRRLEFDADRAGGALYGALMREFDHPVPGPSDGQNERFYIFTIVAAVSTFIVFEEHMGSRSYSPPAWRVHHFFDGFLKEFLQSMSADDRRECTESVFTAINHVEARYADLGWGNGFNFGAASASSDEFLNDDLPGLRALERKFKEYMPHIWPKEREHNR